MRDDVSRGRKSSSTPTRGLVNDNDDTEATRHSAAQKSVHLELMLGQIANSFPNISRNSIVKNSTLAEIWQKILQYFGFQSTGAHFLDLTNIRFERDERADDMFQRLTAF